MKNILTFSIIVCMIAIVASCSKESINKGNPVSSPSLRSSECCVEVPETTSTNIIGRGTGADKGDVQVWNDNDNVYVSITSTCAFDSSFVYIGGCPAPSKASTNGVKHTPKATTYTYTFPNTYEACSDICVTVSITGAGGMGCGGGAGDGTLTHTVKDICEPCVDDLTATPLYCNEDGSRAIDYTFTSDEALDYVKIQGGLTNWTGADAVVTVTGGTGITVTQSTPGGSSNRIITVEGGVGACEVITIHIEWNSSNPGGEMTGGWSAKDIDGNLIDDEAEQSCP